MELEKPFAYSKQEMYTQWGREAYIYIVYIDLSKTFIDLHFI